MDDLKYLTPGRWVATVTYYGPLTVTHHFDELEQLQYIIERGPNFYLIESIVVAPNPDREGYKECRQDALENSDMPRPLN